MTKIVVLALLLIVPVAFAKVHTLCAPFEANSALSDFVSCIGTHLLQIIIGII